MPPRFPYPAPTIGGRIADLAALWRSIALRHELRATRARKRRDFPAAARHSVKAEERRHCARALQKFLDSEAPTKVWRNASQDPVRP